MCRNRRASEPRERTANVLEGGDSCWGSLVGEGKPSGGRLKWDGGGEAGPGEHIREDSGGARLEDLRGHG